VAEACALYEKVLVWLPESAVANKNLAWLLATCTNPALRRPARSVELARKATESRPLEPDYWSTLGTALYRAGDWKGAIAALEKSLELRHGGDSAAWFFLAMATWQTGDKKEARIRFEQAVQWMKKHQPGDEQLASFRAEAEEILELKKN
jgi:tetratricopeptide (TPR) repeat protein